VQESFDVKIIKFESILNNSQPDATKVKLRRVLTAFDHWEMAGEKLFTALYFHRFNVSASDGACDICNKIIYNCPGVGEETPYGRTSFFGSHSRGVQSD
jgi:hypothetical protein